jgi:hypothetical protein
MRMQRLGLKIVAALGVALGAAVLVAVHASAQSAGSSNFSLEVTPSPIIVSVKPGESKTVDLKIRNNGTQDEILKIEPRSFTIESQTGQVKLGTGAPAEVKDWVHFAESPFSVAKAQVYTQRITFDVPANAGFSYSFAVVISRDKPVRNDRGQAVLGSVADFTLLSIDRPGAARKITIDKFAVTKRLYEYLPATFETTISNKGNTFVQPSGNIYVSRKHGASPITVLPLNPTAGYILPGSSRSLSVDWKDGFPVFVDDKPAANAKAAKKLEWNFAHLQQFRFGKYTAQAVAIYNDGNRQVPVTAEVNFWVIPWKVLLILIAVVLILGIGIWTIVRRSFKMVKHNRGNGMSK